MLGDVFVDVRAYKPKTLAYKDSVIGMKHNYHVMVFNYSFIQKISG
jgi:hypothetical protein